MAGWRRAAGRDSCASCSRDLKPSELRVKQAICSREELLVDFGHAEIEPFLPLAEACEQVAMEPRLQRHRR